MAFLKLSFDLGYFMLWMFFEGHEIWLFIWNLFEKTGSLTHKQSYTESPPFIAARTFLSELWEGCCMFFYQSRQKLFRHPLDSAEVLPAWVGACVLSTCFRAEGCERVTKARGCGDGAVTGLSEIAQGQ